jgi:hypothetical protein
MFPHKAKARREFLPTGFLLYETDYATHISIEPLRHAGVPIKTDEGRSGLMPNEFN